MKVYFCPTMFTDVKNELSKSKVKRTISGHKFQENLLHGLIDNGIDVSVLNVLRVKYYPQYSEIKIKTFPFVVDGKDMGVTVGILNLRWLNYLTGAFQLFRYARREIKKNKSEKIVFIVFNTHIPQSPVLLLLRRLYPHIQLCDIIGDLGGSYGVAVPGKGIHASLVRWLRHQSNRMAHAFDCFGLLTDDMADAIKVRNKPYVVMEGFYRDTSEMQVIDAVEEKEKIIFYAGYLGSDYGIEHLLRAFSLIREDEYRLVIAGYDAADDMIEKFAARDSRIMYLGFITPDEVEKWLQRATVLISPRTSEHEFVKYSFPSKTLECLASGKPFIAHNLPCNPKEYDEYIQYPKDESDEALANKIIEVCSLSKEKRDEIGERARQFILTQKSPRVQCKKIVDMMNCLIQQ